LSAHRHNRTGMIENSRSRHAILLQCCPQNLVEVRSVAGRSVLASAVIVRRSFCYYFQ
jgi:hypothetical protein